MTPRVGSITSAFLMVALAALLAAGTWGWRRAARRAPSLPPPEAAGERVREAYPPAPPDFPQPAVKAELLEQVVAANPFSVQRRAKPPAAEPGGGAGPRGGAARPPAAPQFLYKGRIEMGSRVRAILQEGAGGKTHFLELGQEVAGFKVLDITETQVLLSNSQTREEITVALNAPARP